MSRSTKKNKCRRKQWQRMVTLEVILERSNLNRAYKQVRANKRGQGVDGMTVGKLACICRRNSGNRDGGEIHPLARTPSHDYEGGERQIPIVIVRNSIHRRSSHAAQKWTWMKYAEIRKLGVSEGKA